MSKRKIDIEINKMLDELEYTTIDSMFPLDLNGWNTKETMEEVKKAEAEGKIMLL